MRFLNPRTDYAFKKIFGSDDSRDILISFLNAVLGFEGEHAIVDVTILDPYQAPKIKGWKDSYVDVKAQDQSGRVFIVEMQVLYHGALEKRILYNACKAYVGQISEAEAYRQLAPVIGLTITDFIMFRDLPGIVNSFRLRADADAAVIHEDLSLVFIELPKFTKEEADLADTLDRWLYFLRRAGQLTLAPKNLAADPAVDHALRIANKSDLTPEELEDQERREQWIGMQKDMLTDADEARARGLAQGLEAGRAEGLKLGRAEGIEAGRAEGIEAGRAEGIEAGRAEGEALGLTKGAARFLTRLLTKRFGPLPATAQAQIDAADLATLEVWTENAAAADSLNGVLSAW